MRVSVATHNFAGIIHELQTGQGLPYQRLDRRVVGNPTYIGLDGGYRSRRPFEDKLILEWKVQRTSENTSLLNHVETDLEGERSPFTNAGQQVIGQQVIGQADGKPSGHGNVAILVARYEDRVDHDETAVPWITHLYPLFRQAIEQNAV